MASKEMATIGVTDYPVLSGDSSMAEILEENLGPDGLTPGDLTRIGVPRGGGKFWTIPGLEGEESIESIECIILDWNTTRVYWELSIDEGGGDQEPDCSSKDGKTGSGMFGVGSDHNADGKCASCPMSQWGSGAQPDPKTGLQPKSGSQACKEQRNLTVLRPGSILPLSIQLPPTSIAPLRDYMKRLANAGLSYYRVVTSLGISVKKGTYTYSVVAPTLAGRLDPETNQSVAEFRDLVRQK